MGIQVTYNLADLIDKAEPNSVEVLNPNTMDSTVTWYDLYMGNVDKDLVWFDNKSINHEQVSILKQLDVPYTRS